MTRLFRLSGLLVAAFLVWRLTDYTVAWLGLVDQGGQSPPGFHSPSQSLPLAPEGKG